MRKCIHGQVKPCHICKHDYDRAAPYVVDDPPESLQRCYAVIERLQSQLDQSQKMQLKHKQQADIAVAKVADLRAEAARLETERDNWIETAREYANNADFFRSLVVKCGVAIGAESYIQDDGGISEDVLCIKVPTLVEKLIAENARLRDAVLNAYHTGHDHTVEGGFQWCAVGSQEVADEIIAEALNPTNGTDIHVGTKPTSARGLYDE